MEPAKKHTPSLANPKERRQIIRGLLRKHAAIVHIEGSIGIVERRAYNIFLLYAMGQHRPDGNYTFSIPVATLKELIAFNSKNDEHLKQCIKNLQKTVLEVNLLQDGKVKWESMTLLSYASIVGGVCTYRFDPAIMQYLLSPEIYASINLSVQNLLSSSRALALYENCARFRSVGSTGAWDLALVKLMLGAHREASYEDYKAFNRRCIEPAIKEINERSDIEITPEPIKDKRRVVAIRFHVKPRQQHDFFVDRLDDPEAAIKRTPLYLRLRALGLSESQALLYAQTKDKERLEAALQCAESKPDLRDRGRYFLALLSAEVDAKTLRSGEAESVIAITRQTIKNEEAAASGAQAAAPTDIRERSRLIQSHIDRMRPQEIRAIMQDFYESRPDLSYDENGYPNDIFQRKSFTLQLRARVSAMVA